MRYFMVCIYGTNQRYVSVLPPGSQGTLFASRNQCHRYRFPVVVLVMNNAGIYGGDRRQDALATAAQTGMQAGGFGSDPAPTAFVPHARWARWHVCLLK